MSYVVYNSPIIRDKIRQSQEDEKYDRMVTRNAMRGFHELEEEHFRQYVAERGGEVRLDRETYADLRRLGWTPAEVQRAVARLWEDGMVEVGYREGSLAILVYRTTAGTVAEDAI